MFHIISVLLGKKIFKFIKKNVSPNSALVHRIHARSQWTLKVGSEFGRVSERSENAEVVRRMEVNSNDLFEVLCAPNILVN